MPPSIDIPNIPGAFPISGPPTPTYDPDQPTRLTNLPVELLLNTLGYLDHPTLKSTLAVDRHLNRVIHQHLPFLRDLIIHRQYHDVQILAPRPAECKTWHDITPRREDAARALKGDETESRPPTCKQCEDVNCVLLMGACLRIYFPAERWESMRRRHEDVNKIIKATAIATWGRVVNDDWAWLALLHGLDAHLGRTLESWGGEGAPGPFWTMAWLARRTRRELLCLYGLSLMCGAGPYRHLQSAVDQEQSVGIWHGVESLKRANDEATVRGVGAGQRVGIGV